MKNTLRILAALMILLPALAAQAGTQGRANGKVVDSAGNPVEGANITVTTPSIRNFKLSVTTKKDGTYGFIVNDATMLYDLKIEKEGFVGREPRQAEVLDHRDHERSSADHAQAFGGPVRQGGPPGRPRQPLLPPRNRPLLAYNAAVDLLNSGDKAGAEAKLKEAVAKNPDLPQAWQALALVAHQNKDWAKTLEYGQKALDLDPSATNLYGMMTDAAEKSGDKKAAAEWRKKYDEANPDSPEILYNKGVEAYNKGKMKDAEATLSKAVEANRTSPWGISFSAWSLST